MTKNFDAPRPTRSSTSARQKHVTDKGASMRLGAYPCRLTKSSPRLRLYGETTDQERHRHRYEVNNEYRDSPPGHGMVFSGVSPDYGLVEIIELPEHPYFIATQFHPEFKSRPNRAHPLFAGLIAAAIAQSRAQPARCWRRLIQAVPAPNDTEHGRDGGSRSSGMFTEDAQDEQDGRDGMPTAHSGLPSPSSSLCASL